jgi:DNA repair exonuclease SbcCD ATPase subunit
MANRLRLKKVEWTNFLSYGDYVSSVDLDAGGPILIVGQNRTGHDKSNGAGKSTISLAICWCLFGRVPRKAAPGDKVINWFTKGECWVRITTTDGWVITRTRKVNGHDDLLLHKDGIDVTLSTNINAQKFLKKTFNLDYDIFVSSVFCGQFQKSFLSMSDQSRKATLERLLGLNRLNILGDVAKEQREQAEQCQVKVKASTDSRIRELERIESQINQSKQKALEFAEAKRVKMRELQLKYDTHIKTMHEYDWVLDALAIKAEWAEYQSSLSEINTQKEQLNKLELAMRTVDQDIPQLSNSISQQQNWQATIPSYDLNDLKEKHSVADTAEKTKSELNKALETARLDKRKLDQDLARVDGIILEWDQKAGKECPSCKQSISADHTSSLCKPYIERNTLLLRSIEKMDARISGFESEIGTIVITRPSCSLEQARKSNDESARIATTLADLRDKLLKREQQKAKLAPVIMKTKIYVKQLESALAGSDIETRYSDLMLATSERDSQSKLADIVNRQMNDEEKRSNPYKDMAADLTSEYAKVDEALCADKLLVQKIDRQISHLEYIRRSYHDRNKIKMFILSDIIPALNQRIEYYLNAFECDFLVKFTSTLSVEPSRWDYDFHSGGECKRIDLAIMFALYDVYIMLYGSQCNVMVLDEVDSSLDGAGVRNFVDMIQNDFAGDRQDKPDTILIITHKKEMVDQFSNQIMVKMDENRQSHIVST